MLGGEHKKERFSERLTGEQNQPKNRGYLPGTEVKTGGYKTAALMGNWSEERADAGYYDGNPGLQTDQQRQWTTSYREMSRDLPQGKPSAFDQGTMIDIVDHTKSSYPGHQPHLDKQRDEVMKSAFQSTNTTAYASPEATRAIEHAYVPAVVSGLPGAQARGVLLRIRHQMEVNMPGRSAFPGNIARTVQQSLLANSNDASGSGQINQEEMMAGFGAVGIDVSEPECIALIRHYDRVGKGCVPATLLAQELRGVVNDRREQIIQNVYTLLESLCEDGLVRLGRLVELVDLSYLEDSTASPEECLAAFEEQWDAPHRNAYIKSDRFLSFFSDASFEVANDCDFERMMRNMWHMSGGNGKSANTSCRRVEVVHTNGRITTEEIKNDLAIKGDGPDVDSQIRENLAKQGVKDIKKLRVL